MTAFRHKQYHLVFPVDATTPQTPTICKTVVVRDSEYQREVARMTREGWRIVSLAIGVPGEWVVTVEREEASA